MVSFNDFIEKYSLKNEATSNLNLYEVLKKIGLDTKVGFYLRDGQFSADIGIVNLHPTKGTQWVCYINEKYFDGYVCSPPKELSDFFKKRNGHCLYSEYKTQSLTIKRDSYGASYCFYILYLTKVLGIDFESAVLNLF